MTPLSIKNQDNCTKDMAKIIVNMESNKSPVQILIQDSIFFEFINLVTVEKDLQCIYMFLFLFKSCIMELLLKHCLKQNKHALNVKEQVLIV